MAKTALAAISKALKIHKGQHMKGKITKASERAELNDLLAAKKALKRKRR